MEILRLLAFVLVPCMMMFKTVRGDGTCRKLENTLSDKLLDMLVAIKSGKKIEDDTIGSKRPAFFVSLRKHPFPMESKGTILKFDRVILNRGNGYSTTNGQFTAPISGLYQFSITIMSVAGDHLQMKFYHNGKTLINLYGPKINGGAETANPVLELAKGDTIDIRHDATVKQYVHGAHWSYMSGFYIGN